MGAARPQNPQFAPYGAYLSSKDQIELDCRGRRARRTYSSDHPQPMGQGALLHSEYGPMSWNDALPGTILGRVVDIACKTADADGAWRPGALRKWAVHP